jgi:hypothetical protein
MREPLKHCHKCNNDRPLEDFQRNKHTFDGLQAECRTCRSQRQKEWYHSNSDVQRERVITSRENLKKRNDSRYGTYKCNGCHKSEPEVRFHRRKVGDRYYRYFLCTKCKAEYSKKYPAKLTEEIKQRNREMARHNRSKRENMAKYMTKNAIANDKAMGRVSDITIQFVEQLVNDAGGCTYCGDTEARLSLDRIDCSIGHNQNNVIASCVRCNHFRGNMPFEAWKEVAIVIKSLRERGILDDWRGRLPISSGVKPHPNYK